MNETLSARITMNCAELSADAREVTLMGDKKHAMRKNGKGIKMCSEMLSTSYNAMTFII
ncbi:hypothetical protein QUF75_05845 [Desulfococcaceae bacterium HSG7]|nr:hypothetical protein [Desulfococcaceae bacterium HSG7]